MNYETMKRTLENALHDLAILAGDRMGPSDVTWQDVAGTAALNLRALADMIERARNSPRSTAGFVTFPSPAEALEAAQK